MAGSSKLAGAPRLAGVVGWPVAHSLSPLIHTIWAARAKINAYYTPLEIPDDDDAFRHSMDSLRVIGFAGVNVTIPHKERALNYADSVSARAKRAGAVNMLTFSEDGAYGDNSDIAGFAAALGQHLRAGDKKQRALILGAGGAARGVAVAALEAGYGDIAVANRTRARAETLVKNLGGLRVVDWERREETSAGADLVVNATALGMRGQPPLDFSLEHLESAAIVADIVYQPLATPLLAAAAARGLRCVDGLSMLMHQAAPGFRAWFGAAPAVDDALRKELVNEMERRETGEAGARMIKIGLTGSIGMGKSTVAAMFADLGAGLWSADDAVHRMYGANGSAVGAIEELFPDVIIDGAVDRAKLAALVLTAPGKLKKLEAVVHPLAAADREAFMTAAAHVGAELVVLDIPLLYENASEKDFDAVIVVTAPPAVQRARVLQRPGMNEEKLEAILARQMPDAQKRAKADYVISTDRPREETRKEVRRIFEDLMARVRGT